MEMAEHAFLRHLGLSVHGRLDGQVITWPRVHAECTYSAPLTFEDQVELHLLVRKKRRKTIEYAFRLYKQGAEQPVAQGSLTVVCASIDAAGRMSAIAIPECIDRLIEVAPKETHLAGRGAAKAK
jgi:acyl-CoA thioesterase FadM